MLHFGSCFFKCIPPIFTLKSNHWFKLFHRLCLPSSFNWAILPCFGLHRVWNYATSFHSFYKIVSLRLVPQNQTIPTTKPLKIFNYFILYSKPRTLTRLKLHTAHTFQHIFKTIYRFKFITTTLCQFCPKCKNFFLRISTTNKIPHFMIFT